MTLWGITRPRVPDFFTLGNAVCGALSVLILMRVGHTEQVVFGLSALQTVSLLLVLGTIFDSLDGATARVFGGSALGSQLDSLTDGLTFGLVPAALLATIAIDSGATGGTYVMVVVGLVVYVGAALLRLADFSAVRCDKADFVGLPSPLGAMLVVAAAYTTVDPLVLALVLIGVGYLMVSGLRFPHQGKEMLPFALAAWALVVGGALHVLDPVLLVAAIYVLVLVGLPALALRSRHRTERDHGTARMESTALLRD